MKILFYAGSLRHGGGATMARNMLHAMASNPDNVVTVYTGVESFSAMIQPVVESFDNVVEQRFCFNRHHGIRYALSKLYFFLTSLFNRDTVVITVNFHLPTLSKLIVYHLNLLHFQTSVRDKIGKKIRDLDAATACRRADLNLFESAYLKQAAESHIGNRINNPAVLYAGIDPAFKPPGESGPRYKQGTNILIVSSTQPHKDNETCIRMLDTLYQRHPASGWTVTIAGGGSAEEWSSLVELAMESGLENKITVLGPVDKEALSRLMNESLCLVSASKVESFCMVALEAMASGCPAVVTGDTSMPESVGEAAIIVESGSAEQFADAVAKIYLSTDFRSSLVERGLAHASRFSYQSFSSNLNRLIG